VTFGRRDAGRYPRCAYATANRCAQKAHMFHRKTLIGPYTSLSILTSSHGPDNDTAGTPDGLGASTLARLHVPAPTQTEAVAPHTGVLP